MPKAKAPKKNAGTDPSVVNADAVAPKSAATAEKPVTSAPEGSIAMKTEASKKAGKPEIVKQDSRSNLIPINLEDEIRRLAYLFSERRGFEPGHETEDWLSAEREVYDRYHQYTA